MFTTWCLCASAASAPPVTPATVTYDDPVGDAGDAPDVARVTVEPASLGTLRVCVTLAAPTELGPYGWILVGFDTDRNVYTGAVYGNDVLLVANGEGAVLERWVRGRFAVDFAHQPLDVSLLPTELDATIRVADLGTSKFAFRVATLRQDADLAPDAGAYMYGAAKPRRDVHGTVQTPPRRGRKATSPHRVSRR